MSMEDEFTALTCPNCGGAVKLTKATIDDAFIAQGDGVFIFIGGSTPEDARCQHCGTAFVRKQAMRAHAEGGAVTGNTAIVRGSGAIAQGPGAVAVGRGGIVVSGVTGSSVIVTGGDLVIRRD